MNLLVTAGNTQVLIDRVRCITNVFTGRTGAGIARHAAERGHGVTLLTSHPETVAETGGRLRVAAYQTFDELARALEEQVRAGDFDGLIHCAAVSDYRSAGVFAPSPGTSFDPATGHWQHGGGPPSLESRAAGKVKSDEPELWLRLVRTPKLVDHVRGAWGFGGVLVKFKLEVGVTEEQLVQIAEHSRRQSAADLMVANTLEGASAWAYLGPLADGYERVGRAELARRLLDEVERLHGRRARG